MTLMTSPAMWKSYLSFRCMLISMSTSRIPKNKDNNRLESGESKIEGFFPREHSILAEYFDLQENSLSKLGLSIQMKLLLRAMTMKKRVRELHVGKDTGDEITERLIMQ